MSETKHTLHTPEPWIYLEEVQEIDASQLRGPTGQEIAMRMFTPNADRIVACVNACAGIYDPKQFLAERIDLNAQNERMRKALECIEKYHSNGTLNALNLSALIREALK
jgi:hypothetical protein